MNRVSHIGGLALLVLSAIGANPAEIFADAFEAIVIAGDPLTGDGNVERSELTVSDLLTPDEQAAPVSDAAFALPANAAAPVHSFEGGLVLAQQTDRGGYRSLRDDFGIADLAEDWKHPPALAFELVQNGSHLIPVERSLIITAHSGWNIIVSPGRVWRENSDQDYSRAAIPFALIEKNANCTHNGVLMFLFNNDEVSQARYQITQETCEYHKFDMWGELPASYQRHPVTGSARIRTAYAEEISKRLPAVPFAQLAGDYPGVDVTQFDINISAEHVTTRGLLINGVHYTDRCRTRYGDYPYCEVMILPSYSTAKSAFAAVALMALVQDYGAEVADLLISDYTPETATAAGDWSGVTFANTLDMATGNYNSAVYPADEAGTRMAAFFLALNDAVKTEQALGFSNNAPAGTQFVYHTSDTYLLTRSMNRYLQKRQDTTADIFDYLVAKVLAPLKLNPLSFESLRTTESDGSRGQPFGGYGLFWTQDTIARIAKFIHQDGGKINGQQIIDAAMLQTALQQNAAQNPANSGLDAGGDFQYKYGFWALEFGPAGGYDCSFRVPFMSGYGGITVALLPQGGVYYIFSDNGEFAWATAVREVAKILPYCG